MALCLYQNTGECPCNLSDRFTLSGMVTWLRDRGIIDSPPAIVAEVSSIDRVLQEYGVFLMADRGLARTTIENYCGYVTLEQISTYGLAHDDTLLKHRAQRITDMKAHGNQES
jgi:hypothetical protein